jgi:hypothetical protein
MVGGRRSYVFELVTATQIFEGTILSGASKTMKVPFRKRDLLAQPKISISRSLQLTKYDQIK